MTDYKCENGHIVEMEDHGPPELLCLLCGSENWEEVNNE